MVDSEKPPAPKAPKPPAKKPNRAQLVADAWDLRKTGYSHADIASELKTSVEDVAAMIGEGISQVIVEKDKAGLVIEIERINQMLSGMYASATAGDAISANISMQLMKRRRELEGMLSAAPDEDASSGAFSITELMDLVPYEHRPAPPSTTEFYKSGPKKGQAKPGKKPNGRPPHKVDEKTVGIVGRLAVSGCGKVICAKIIGVDEATFAKYYGEVYEAARPMAVAGLTHMMAMKARKSESANRWLLATLDPETFAAKQVAAKRDLAREGGTGAEQTGGRIEIVGGLPGPPGSWAEPPGQAEAIAKFEESNPRDDFDAAIQGNQTGSNVTIIPPAKAAG